MEEQLKNLNFQTLNIIQPSHLLGEREKPNGLDVKIFEAMTNITGNLLLGPLAKFKNVNAIEFEKLMYEIADYVSYTRTSDDRNCLLIVKRYWPYSQEQNDFSDCDT